jgi:tetratricopeptide (TPR) repeat protein
VSARVLILDPDQPPSWQPSRAQTCNKLAGHLALDGEPHLRDPAQAVALAQEAVRLAPEMKDYWNTLVLAQNQLAWLLANCPDAGVRNPKRALQLAKEVIEKRPGWGEALNTLGAAHYRAGDWKAAIETLTAAANNEGPPVGWFFLAMAQAKLANMGEARQWYDRADQWMQKNQPKNAELLRFRAEAAQVLGLEKTPE